MSTRGGMLSPQTPDPAAPTRLSSEDVRMLEDIHLACGTLVSRRRQLDARLAALQEEIDVVRNTPGRGREEEDLATERSERLEDKLRTTERLRECMGNFLCREQALALESAKLGGHLRKPDAARRAFDSCVAAQQRRLEWAQR